MVEFCLSILSLIMALQFGKLNCILETIEEDLKELSKKHIMPTESKDSEEW